MRFGDVFTTECVPANCYQECLFTQNKVKGSEGGGVATPASFLFLFFSLYMNVPHSKCLLLVCLSE